MIPRHPTPDDVKEEGGSMNNTRVIRRYPLQDLAVAMRVNVAGLGRSLGVSGSQLNEYRDRGVTEKVGDRLATKAGFATYEVWPEMLDHAIEDILRKNAEEQEIRRLAKNAAKRRWYAANREQVCAVERQRYHAEIAYRRKKAARRYLMNAEIEKTKARQRRQKRREGTSGAQGADAMVTTPNQEVA